MRGKEKCKALKEIRKQIAEKNDIEYAVSECSYHGECKGTCPKCEAELRYLEKELERRKNLGKAVCVVGISASVCGGLTACNPAESVRDFVSDVFNIGVTEETAGVVPAPVLTGDMEIAPESTKIPVEDIDGDIALPEATEEPVSEQNGDMQVPMPLPEEITPELMGELPEETLAPAELEGKLVELPLQEVLEGDVAIIEGGIMVAPEATAAPEVSVEPLPSQAPAEEEMLAGDIPLAPEE